jgi:hypothetical protein
MGSNLPDQKDLNLKKTLQNTQLDAKLCSGTTLQQLETFATSLGAKSYTARESKQEMKHHIATSLTSISGRTKKNIRNGSFWPLDI